MKFYVYGHYTADTGELFYIGKGTGYRHKDRRCRNPFWNNVVNKHGFVSKILFDNIAEDYAYFQEYLAIKEFRPRCNITDGGTGFTSFQVKEMWKNPEYRERMIGYQTSRWSSEENKKAHSARLSLSWSNPEYKARVSKSISQSLTGKPLSESHRAKTIYSLLLARESMTKESHVKAGLAISKKLKGKPKGEKHRQSLRIARLGTKHSEKTKLQMSLSAGSQQFYVFKKKSLEYVGCWINKEECSRVLNLDGSRVSDCLKNKRKTHKGYVFSYKKEV